MKLDRLNTWLNLFGQLAVFAGLIALVVEIRGNSQSLRAQELATLEDRDSARQVALFSSELRDVYTKALYSPVDLTIDEMMGTGLYHSYRMATVAVVYTRVRQGTLQQSDWDSFATTLPIFLGNKFGRT